MSMRHFHQLRSRKPDADPFHLMLLAFASGRLHQDWGALRDAYKVEQYIDPEAEGRLAGTLFRLYEEEGCWRGHPHSRRMREYLYPELFEKSK